MGYDNEVCMFHEAKYLPLLCLFSFGVEVLEKSRCVGASEGIYLCNHEKVTPYLPLFATCLIGRQSHRRPIHTHITRTTPRARFNQNFDFNLRQLQSTHLQHCRAAVRSHLAATH